MNSTEPKKSYSIDFQDRGRYLFAHIKGKRGTLEIATGYWQEIAQRTIEAGVKRVLVVEDIPEMISIAEVHQLVTSLADLPVKDVRLAFVDLYAEHSSLNDFGVLVSENRGFSVRSFDTEEAAEAWLLED
ncbi:MAG TPA: hypothetical protein VFZ49_09595 [Pyrinomonadaceae bacterium]